MANFDDINSFFFHKKKKPAEDEKPKKRTTGVDESQPKKKEPVPAQVRFVSAQFEPHSVYGYAPRKEAVITGSVELLSDTNNRTITLELFAIYNTVEENLGLNVKKYCTTEIDKNKKFKFTGVPLEYHKKYPLNDNREEFKTAVTYKAVISHKHHEKPIEITVQFPDANVKPVDLKKGMYDHKIHNVKPGKYPADPQKGYVPGQPIFDLQQILESYLYLPSGTANGFFGEKTETAVKAFQSDSNQKLRLLNGSSKLIEIDSITFASDVYGIVNKKTRDELMTWKYNNYLRPIPELYEHDFDSEATDRQVKSRNESGFFEKGKPVLSVQKNMQKVGVYADCSTDGWFGPKMKEAVGIFQDAAATGKFIINGVETEIEEKLTGFRRGVLDVWTQVHMKKVAEKGGKVAKDSALMHYPLPKEHRDKGYHSGARAFGSNRSEDRVHAGCDLYAPAGTKVYAIADGIINQYYDYYWQTYALEVNHAGKIVLYGEIQPPKNGHGYSDDIPPENLRSGLPDGVTAKGIVKRGQHIAYVGQLRPVDKKSGKRYNFSDTMVHFEMYKGTATGELTQKNNLEYENVPKKKYMRRKDILNPTEELDKMSDD